MLTYELLISNGANNRVVLARVVTYKRVVLEKATRHGSSLRPSPLYWSN